RTSPNGLAGLDFHRGDGPIRAADDHHASAVYRRNDRRRINSVVRTASRRAGPDALAVQFIKGKKSMLSLSGVSPAVDDCADNYQIPFDDWRRGAAPVRGPRSELFGERAAPQHLAVIRQCGQLIARAEDIDVTRGRISNRGRPGDAARRNVALIDVQAMLPQELSRVGV